MDNVQRVDKFPESSKTAEKLESLVDHDLKNIQNVTPDIHLINNRKEPSILSKG